jgi:hypothetical protein
MFKNFLEKNTKSGVKIGGFLKIFENLKGSTLIRKKFFVRCWFYQFKEVF